MTPQEILESKVGKTIKTIGSKGFEEPTSIVIVFEDDATLQINASTVYFDQYDRGTPVLRWNGSA